MKGNCSDSDLILKIDSDSDFGSDSTALLIRLHGAGAKTMRWTARKVTL